jgi:hypothetical protein
VTAAITAAIGCGASREEDFSMTSKGSLIVSTVVALSLALAAPALAVGGMGGRGSSGGAHGGTSVGSAAASRGSSVANAQNGGECVAPELSRPTPGHLLNRDYLTATGQTVARPGVPQSSGETPLDHFVEQQDNRIDNSICKGC